MPKGLFVVLIRSYFLVRIDKLTGAYYLGELTRRVLEQLVVDNQIFGGLPSDSLSTLGNFPTKYISEILKYSWALQLGIWSSAAFNFSFAATMRPATTRTPGGS